MEEKLIDNRTIAKRVVRYPVTGNKDEIIGRLSGHCNKTCIEVKILSTEYNDQFLKAIRPLEDMEKSNKLSEILQHILHKKDKSFTQRVGTGDIPEPTIDDCVIAKSLIEKLLSGDCHYGTYLKDFDGHIPHRLSCIVKSCAPPNVYRECVCSILGEMFGVDTVYNFTQDMFPDKTNAKAAKPDKSLLDSEYYDDENVYSVDFIPYGYRFEDLSEFDLLLYSNDTLEQVHAKVLEMQARLSHGLGMAISHKQMEELAHEICKQVFVKRGFFRDWDVTARNFGVLFNKETGDIISAPMHDMELSFSPFQDKNWHETVEADIDIMMKKYPEDLYDIMGRANSALESGDIDRVLNTTMKCGLNKYNKVMQVAQVVKESITKAGDLFQIAIAKKYVSAGKKNERSSEDLEK